MNAIQQIELDKAIADKRIGERVYRTRTGVAIGLTYQPTQPPFSADAEFVQRALLPRKRESLGDVLFAIAIGVAGAALTFFLLSR